MDNLRWLSAVDLARAICDGRLTARNALEALISRVERDNPSLNAIVKSYVAEARRAADLADDAIRRGGSTGPLHGVAITIKDTFDVAGMSSTAGSQALAGRVATRDAEAVARLRAAGAIVFGRSNTPAYAGDAQCDSELYGRTNNPWDVSRTPGGSSGGAAAAVAAGLVPLELGSDAGGSLRIPAHFCGVATHKPTQGLVPTQGHMPPPPGRPDFPDMLNVVGPIARNVSDLVTAMRVLTTERGLRLTRIEPSRPNPANIRIAWAPDFATPSNTTTRAALSGTAEALTKAGFVVRELDLAAIPIRDLVQLHWKLVDVCYRSWYGNGPESSLDSLAALILEKDRCADAVELLLTGVDCLILPVAPVPAPAHCPKLSPIPVDGEPRDYWEVLVADCQPFNVTGHPVTSIPVAISSDGLPIGVQLVGRRFSDFRLLALARLVEQAVGFHGHPPTMASTAN